MFLAREVRPSWCGRTREVCDRGAGLPGGVALLAIGEQGCCLAGNRGAGLPGGVVRSGVTLKKRQLAGRQRVSQRPRCGFRFPPSVLPSFHSFFSTPVVFFFCFLFVCCCCFFFVFCFLLLLVLICCCS